MRAVVGILAVVAVLGTMYLNEPDAPLRGFLFALSLAFAVLFLLRRS